MKELIVSVDPLNGRTTAVYVTSLPVRTRYLAHLTREGHKFDTFPSVSTIFQSDIPDTRQERREEHGSLRGVR